VACGAVARPRCRPGQRELSDAHADHVRELRARARYGASTPDGGNSGSNRARARDPAARTAADLPGRVRLPRVRAHGRPARPRPLHAFRRRSTHRPGLPVRRLAVSALPVRPAVHARKLRHRAVLTRERTVGVQGAGRALEPGRGGVDRTHRPSPRAKRALGGELRRAEPRAARAGSRRRAQRHAGDGAARACAHAERRCESPPASRRGRAGAWRGREADRGAGAAVSRARLAVATGAPAHGAERGARPARADRGGRRRLRRARARLPRRGGRATAARGHAQHPRRDRAPGGPERHASVVAPSFRGGFRGRARRCAVAYGAGRGLARGGWVDDARAAAVHRVAAAVVRDLAAAASGRQRRSAPDRRHARVLRVRRPHPPLVCRPPA
jgi:hypothetical protein